MANTDIVKSLPQNSNGISVVSSASSWNFGSWVCLHQRIGLDIIITSLCFAITYVPASTDTTYEMLFELGEGDQGSETKILQIPHSIRADTKIAHYMHMHSLYLPEGLYINRHDRLSVRVANSVATAVTYNAVKIMYTVPGQLVENSDYELINNYQFARSVSAGVISLGERIR